MNLNLISVLHDLDGKVSSTRLLKLAFGLGILAVWIMTSLHTGALAAFTPDSIVLIFGILGFSTAQKVIENKAAADTAAPTTTKTTTVTPAPLPAT